jgi:Antirestriction protein
MKINTYSNIFDRLVAVLLAPQNVIAYEQTVYKEARRYSDYTGGIWKIATVEDYEGQFMFPIGDETYKVAVDTNGYEGEMSNVAFGLFCSICAHEDLMDIAHEQNLDSLAIKLKAEFDKIMNIIYDHEEGVEIVRALD